MNMIKIIEKRLDGLKLLKIQKSEFPRRVEEIEKLIRHNEQLLEMHKAEIK